MQFRVYERSLRAQLRDFCRQLTQLLVKRGVAFNLAWFAPVRAAK